MSLRSTPRPCWMRRRAKCLRDHSLIVWQRKAISQLARRRVTSSSKCIRSLLEIWMYIYASDVQTVTWPSAICNSDPSSVYSRFVRGSAAQRCPLRRVWPFRTLERVDAPPPSLQLYIHPCTEASLSDEFLLWICIYIMCVDLLNYGNYSSCMTSIIISCASVRDEYDVYVHYYSWCVPSWRTQTPMRSESGDINLPLIRACLLIFFKIISPVNPEGL